ncbi:hypothetical protein [Lewinella sp. IMCC34183]|uniref:hypothetical protein n=1 Tax=Lewinella sp. IMCC34183 TaxID=2248762 RepID=UPI000E2842A2|nr:hypothetical protein [Lewinella sp. IMCC34183]
MRRRGPNGFARWVGLFTAVFLAGCQADLPAPPPETAVYHWETQLRLPDSLLRARQVHRLYIKVFDVSYADGRPTPSALLETDRAGLPVEGVPVVFLTNEVFAHPHAGLAADVLRLLERRFPFPYAELQIDCDWTAATRAAYFAFLGELGRLSGKALSCTVRLHQYRDRGTQGVPPVDRAVLMAYNTGDLDRWETENSIFDSAIVDAYLNGQSPYPLPLDLAVAAYDWAVVYRRGTLAYLVNEPDLEALADTARFARLSPTRYRLDSSTYYGGLYLYRNDLLRLEKATAAEARRLGRDGWPRVANAGSRYLIYYHIGSRQWE